MSGGTSDPQPRAGAGSGPPDGPQSPDGPASEGAGPRPDFAPPGRDDATHVLPSAGWRPEHDATTVMPAPAAGAGGTTVQPVQPQPAPPSAAARKPRSRTVMITVIAVLAVLAVLIAGDRVANAITQNVVATNLQQEFSTPTKPIVHIGGFPFVTQALSGSFSSVQVTADDATVQNGQTSVALSHLDATLTQLTTTDRASKIVAGHGEATALVDWSGVTSLVGQQVSYADDGRMKIDFSVPIGQLSITGSITGRPELNVDDQTITVVDPQVTVASVDVPQAVVDAVARIVLRPFPIEGLPYDIKVTGMSVQPDGLQVSGTGENIPIRG